MTAERGCQLSVGVEETVPPTIQVLVNGEERRIPEGQTITDLIRIMELDPERIAVELDRRIVKRAHWSGTNVSAGSQLEIVQFVGGG